MGGRRGRIDAAAARSPEGLHLGECPIQRDAMPCSGHHRLDVAEREQAAEGYFGEPATQLGKTLSRYDRNRWADGRMGRWAVRQVGFRDNFHDRFGTHVRQRIVLMISTEQDKIGRIEIALRYFDSHSLDTLVTLTQPGGVDQTEWEA